MSRVDLLNMALAIACKDLGLKIGEEIDPQEYIDKATEAYRLKGDE